MTPCLRQRGGGGRRCHAWPQWYDHRPSHPSILPGRSTSTVFTDQADIACTKRTKYREMLSKSHEGELHPTDTDLRIVCEAEFGSLCVWFMHMGDTTSHESTGVYQAGDGGTGGFAKAEGDNIRQVVRREKLHRTRGGFRSLSAAAMVCDARREGRARRSAGGRNGRVREVAGGGFGARTQGYRLRLTSRHLVKRIYLKKTT